MRIQLLLLCALLKGTFSYAATFVPDTDDVPLMSELSPCDDTVQGLFSAPEGRIVSFVVKGKTDWIHVSNFYEQSLKNLGWEVVFTSSSQRYTEFKRNSEKLTIHAMKGRNGILFVRFDYVEG